MARAKIVSVATQDRLRTSLSRSGERTFQGFALDEADPSRRLTIEILLDGYPFKVIRADSYAHELATAGLGDGCYGFCFSLPDSVLHAGRTVEARVANVGT